MHPLVTQSLASRDDLVGFDNEERAIMGAHKLV